MSQNHPKEISPAEAFKMLNENNRNILVDIRSSMEYLFVGHPVGSTHIAWIDEPDWTINPQFVTEIRKLLLGGNSDGNNTTSIILICRSGKRSLEAGRALIGAGIENIYHIDEGFEGERDENYHRSSLGGWRFRGLPWEQC